MRASRSALAAAAVGAAVLASPGATALTAGNSPRGLGGRPAAGAQRQQERGDRDGLHDAIEGVPPRLATGP